ncbi:MAG: hypothetical protein S4CHLAM20_13960 [Chlamydiia bacterium]|nr:hypothetical protein [Chlamydiia bacterium]
MQDILMVNPCKVELEDFDYERDLKLRLHLEKLNTHAIYVLEEILYSPLKVSIQELCDNTETSYTDIHSILDSLKPLGLFDINNETLFIKKDVRKYFEMLIEKFEPDFSPNLDYFKDLLKHVPIHCIVSWYHIPRTSNNIFNSIIEKHFKTPKIFEKYITETLSLDPIAQNVADLVLNSSCGKVSCKEIQEKTSLNEEELEKIILFLEYHYIIASSYEVEDNHYTKYLSLFSEWKNWKINSQFSSKEELSLHEDEIQRISDNEFSFIEDMSLILTLCNEIALHVTYNQKDELFYLEDESIRLPGINNNETTYIARVINKNLLLGLCVIEEDQLRQTPPAKKWLETPIKKRTLITFKHPHNALSHKSRFSFKQHDRNIIEVQKALSTIQSGRWIMFDEFMHLNLSSGNSLKQAELKRVGREWKFEAAEYDPKEIEFIKLIVLGWLFESGMIIPGTYQNKDCFKVTSLIYELYS